MRLRGRDRILVIDDSPTVLGMLRYGLGQHGFQVVCARDGAEGLRKALRFRPTVVITDWEMPRIGGAELCRKLRAEDETRDAAIILLSSRSSRADAIKGLREGADEYIVKPFNFERLVATVERLVAERQVRRERAVLRAYVPENVVQLAERLAPGHSDPTTIRPSQRTLTVLYANLAQFSRLAGQLTASETADLLNSLFTKVAEHVQACQGIVERFTGDRILALFGFDDDAQGAQDALRCADALHAAVRTIEHAGAAPLKLKVGVATGHVLFAFLGAHGVRRDFTVIGDAVTTARVLQQSVHGDQTILSHATVNQLASPPAAEPTTLSHPRFSRPIKAMTLTYHHSS